MSVLTLNAGSSSIKFAIYQEGHALQCVLRGQVERIGEADTAIDAEVPDAGIGTALAIKRHPIAGDSFDAAAAALLAWIEARAEFGQVSGVGHRVVRSTHGLSRSIKH